MREATNDEIFSDWWFNCNQARNTKINTDGDLNNCVLISREKNSTSLLVLCGHKWLDKFVKIGFIQIFRQPNYLLMYSHEKVGHIFISMPLTVSCFVFAIIEFLEIFVFAH